MERQAVVGPAGRTFKMSLSFNRYFYQNMSYSRFLSVTHEQKNANQSSVSVGLSHNLHRLALGVGLLLTSSPRLPLEISSLMPRMLIVLMQQ